MITRYRMNQDEFSFRITQFVWLSLYVKSFPYKLYVF